jgi:hypothetical protein
VETHARSDLACVLFASCLIAACSNGAQKSPGAGAADAPARLPGGGSGTVAPAEVPLTASTVVEFITFAGRSGKQEDPYIRGELEKARADNAIIDGILAALSNSWRYTSGQQYVDDVSTVVITFELAKELRSARAAALFEDMAWRPIPVVDAGDPLSVISILEVSAVEALACIPDPGAQAAITKIVNMHPDKSVRDAAANQIRNQYCNYDQSYYNP